MRYFDDNAPKITPFLPEEALMTLCTRIFLSLAVALVTPLTAFAQAYPSKPVRVIIVFPPGGSNDVVGRLVFQKVSDIAGQQFIIDNRGGAAGTLGSEFGAKSPADGYTAMVHPSMPVKNGKEFIALAKKRPGEITYGSAGNGSYVHLSMALMASMAGINMVHVPYKGGGPVNVAIASGEVQAVLATIGSLTANLKAKRVRPLGVSSEERTKAHPNVPA